VRCNVEQQLLRDTYRRFNVLSAYRSVCCMSSIELCICLDDSDNG